MRKLLYCQIDVYSTNLFYQSDFCDINLRGNEIGKNDINPYDTRGK